MTLSEMEELIENHQVCLNEVWLGNVKKLIAVVKASAAALNESIEAFPSACLSPKMADLRDRLAALESDP